MERPVPIRARVGASIPIKGEFFTSKLSIIAASRGLSSGQTIDAARTAVRSACCLPELRGANRLRRLYPLDDGELFKFNLKSSVCQRQTGLPKGNPPCVFPSFPFGNLRFASRSNRAPLGTASPYPPPDSARQAPTGASLCGASRGLSSGQTIGAVRTAVRSACCLPELRVANRLRRLYPLDTRFPSFPPAPLRGIGVPMVQRYAPATPFPPE